MIQHTKTIEDPSNVVSKLLFEDDKAIAEAVAYRYEDRGVVCFSVQSGCPVGCVFCGTGNQFLRNLSSDEMHLQIKAGLQVVGKRDKVQLMSMSMGDPMLNWGNVKPVAEFYLGDNQTYFFVSTVGFNKPDVLNEIINLGKHYSRFGLQFSLHEIDETKRRALFRNTQLPYLSIPELIKWGHKFTSETGNRAYYNYIVKDYCPATVEALAGAFRGLHVTFSVLCNTEKMESGNPDAAIQMANAVFQASGGEVECSTFDPAGQDTVGGGCGQLLFVQEKMKGLKTR
jgi:23S rRNA (adenine2503-C2)-methyltransferase